MTHQTWNSCTREVIMQGAILAIVAEIMYNMCKNAGITLKWYDEPHRGEDQADRESAVAKCYINSYVPAGHNLSSADVKKGIMYLDGPENSKVSIVEIYCTKASMAESIIKNIQSYHGTWKFVNNSNLEFQSGIVVLEPFEECIGKFIGV